jgi:hypothetical protein
MNEKKAETEAVRALEEYERLLAPARERFDQSPGVQTLRSNSDSTFVEAFILYFCAVGSRMTRPVEDWIRRAARRCTAMGLLDLGQALAARVRAESGHELMMASDLRSLIAHWNTHHTPPVSEKLLHCSVSLGAFRYCEVHEHNIAGDTPYAQVAIEYEIERLPFLYGGLFLTRCLEVLGTDILACLSFLTAHVDLDIGHTHFNTRKLAQLMLLKPDSLMSLVAAGSAALDAYAEFLTDCVRFAEAHSQITSSRKTTRRTLRWRIQGPPVEASQTYEGAPSAWLRDLWSLRGYVLFDRGRRPGFRAEDGFCTDSNPMDFYAHHILAYEAFQLIGCVRIYPLSGGRPPCLTESLLGKERFARMLDGLACSSNEVLEIGRWIVHPGFRKSGLATNVGAQLAAGAAMLGCALRKSPNRYRIALFVVGIEDGQDQMLHRLGLTPVRGVEAFQSREYNDTVRIMHCDEHWSPPHSLLRLIVRLPL